MSLTSIISLQPTKQEYFAVKLSLHVLVKQNKAWYTYNKLRYGLSYSQPNIACLFFQLHTLNSAAVRSGSQIFIPYTTVHFPSDTERMQCCYKARLCTWNFILIKKVKVTPVQALRHCTGRTAHRGSRGVAVLIHDHCTRRGVRGQRHAPTALYPGKHPVPIVQEAGWAPGPQDRCEKSRPHQDSSPGPSNLQPVAIPTELLGPLYSNDNIQMIFHQYHIFFLRFASINTGTQNLPF